MPRKSSIKAGDRFGKLIAVETMEVRSPEGFVRWLCECDCGKLKIVSSGMLKIGNNTSCGCAVGYGNQKLSEADAAVILASDKTANELAKTYNLHPSTIRKLRRKHK